MYNYVVQNMTIQCSEEVPALGAVYQSEPLAESIVIRGMRLGQGTTRDLIATSLHGEPVRGVIQLFQNEEEQEQPLINLDSLNCLSQLAPKTEKLRVHLLGMGDVGSHLLIGLKLLGQGVIGAVGIYDLNPSQIERYCLEVNQIYSEHLGNAIDVYGINQDNLFHCDVFVFTASASVPPVTVLDQDVRMAQFEANARIIKSYALMARDSNFSGIFAVVSDPVDLLCQVVYEFSNQDLEGKWDGLGLSNQQIFGFGLGVMHARARYYAQRDPAFSAYLHQGAIFGPHGKELVVVQSTVQYDDSLSQALTRLTTEANIRVRELGFKPFIAPAYSSAALSLIAFLKGEPAHVASYLDGVFFGAKCKRTAVGIRYVQIPFEPQIHSRLEATRSALMQHYRGQ